MDKSGEVSNEEYTARYLDLLHQSVEDYPTHWETLLGMESVAIACYCKAGAFCHRHLMVDFIEQLCLHRKLPFEKCGEIE